MAHHTRPHPPRLPPGPRLPAVVQTVALHRDPVGFLERAARRYGDPLTLRVLPVGDLADIGVARAAAAWLPGLRFVGIATLLVSVTLVLVTIQKTLRFQARRITELAETAETPPRPVAAVS